jgi:hypothetical protein
MSVALASAWHPRSELPRFQNLRPQLARVYNAIVLAVPPDTDRAIVCALEAQPLVFVVVTGDWSHGRHAALQKALETSASHIHYNDFDRLLHWAETRLEEWCATVAVVEKGDCLIVGRTAQA